MELKIDINNRRKLFASIGKDNLCDFPDGILYKFTHGLCKAGNLSREVHTLTPAKVEQLLAVVICHLGSSSHEVGTLCLEETKREVLGKQFVPQHFPSTFREEQTYRGSCKPHANIALSTRYHYHHSQNDRTCPSYN